MVVKRKDEEINMKKILGWSQVFGHIIWTHSHLRCRMSKNNLYF